MSILINGMEMPKDGSITITVTSDGRVVGNSKKENGKFEYLDNEDIATAVHVPPHGRLIEMHDVFKLISAFPEVDQFLPVEFMKALYNLPTIIPAEEAV